MRLIEMYRYKVEECVRGSKMRDREDRRGEGASVKKSITSEEYFRLMYIEGKNGMVSLK